MGKGKGRFDKKQAVRFTLLPGPEKDGKPSVLYKPVESRKTRLSKKERKVIISELADVEEVTINGRVVREDEIPAYVLEQIKGRGDLIFNQIHPGAKEEEEEAEGDLYDIQDGKEDDDEYEEYPDYEGELEMEKVEEGDEWEDEEEGEDEDWEDEEGSYQQAQQEIVEPVEPSKPYAHKEEDFPEIEEKQEVQIDGVKYFLTKTQARLLETVIPEDYQQLDFGGLNFKKYNEDGLPIEERAKYEKYFLKEGEKPVIIDTYEHVPTKPLDFVDNDLKPSQINGNRQVKEVEEALEYAGEDAAYEQLEDDFFAKMIQAELEQTHKEKPQGKTNTQLASKDDRQPAKAQQKEKVKVEAKPKAQPIQPAQTPQQLQAQLQKALFNFDHNIEDSKPPRSDQQDSQQDDEGQSHGNYSMNFTDIQKREEYIGRDGELDWRCLTKKEKREYMKTKVIRQYYDELREREIEDKLKGKSNVTAEELHLKDRVKHITYEEDHVMQRALQEDLNVKVDLDASESESSSFTSDEDDIISFHQKTSIIASNLSIIEEPRKPKAPKAPKPDQPEQPMEPRVKVVPERRNKNETKEQRKERKERLKAQKKEKKEQKKDFADKFSKIKKETMRQENTTNPLNKVSYVKIY